MSTPFVTEADAVEIFTQLESYVIRLEEDPTVMGPSYIHEKLRQCRDFSNSVEALLITYYDKERRIRNLLGTAKAEYDAKKAELLAIDPDVDKKKSAEGRMALVDYKLKATLETIADLKEQLTTCQFVLKAVELRKDGLNRANNDVKKQVSLMEFARGKSGMMAGDDEELPFDTHSGNETPKPHLADDADEDLSGLFQSHSTPPETISPEVVPHVSEPAPVGEVVPESVDDLDAFLDSIDSTQVTPAAEEEEPSGSALDDDDDLSSLFLETVDEKADSEETGQPSGQASNHHAPGDDDVVDIGKFLAQS